MLTKDVYVVQPYEVGSKERKSLAMIIPAEIAREYNVSRSTVLALSINEKDKITLQKVNVADLKNMMIAAAADSIEASSQQQSPSSGTQ
jgi:antitoxin component of MazEF toxin-antitoxin module